MLRNSLQSRRLDLGIFIEQVESRISILFWNTYAASSTTFWPHRCSHQSLLATLQSHSAWLMRIWAAIHSLRYIRSWRVSFHGKPACCFTVQPAMLRSCMVTEPHTLMYGYTISSTSAAMLTVFQTSATYSTRRRSSATASAASSTVIEASETCSTHDMPPDVVMVIRMLDDEAEKRHERSVHRQRLAISCIK